MKRSTLSRRFAGIAVLTALLATAIGPDGIVLGIIENPHFLPAAEDPGEGPGR